MTTRLLRRCRGTLVISTPRLLRASCLRNETIVTPSRKKLRKIPAKNSEAHHRGGRHAAGQTVTLHLRLQNFAGKLRQNRDQLIAKYGCKSVKFQVYVKDGKAAVKATPVSA